MALVLAVLLLGAVTWLAIGAVRTQHALTAARADIVVLESQVRSGDDEGARRTLASLASRTTTAREASHGPLWSVARSLPVLGDDVRATQLVTTTADDLSHHALPGLVDASTVLDPAVLAPSSGGVSTAPVARVAPRVIASDEAVKAAVVQLDAVDTGGLVGSVARPFDAFRDQVVGISRTTATASKVARLFPAMLGADGPRDYLVLVQNNAEQRATGGIPGSVLLLRADHGRIDVVDQRAGSTLTTKEPVLPLATAESALFGTHLVTDMRDVTFTPDFPRSAQLAAALWEKVVGGKVDGVVSVDPVALGTLLGATGPVRVDGTTLTASTAGPLLLNGVYQDRATAAAQDAYFADASHAVLTALLGGATSTRAVVDALARAAGDGRIMLWSAEEDEQAEVYGTVLAGELQGLRTSRAGTSPVVGIYLEDGTQAKLGYYVDLDVSGRATQCRADGSQRLDVTVTLSSRAPSGAADLPRYLVGFSGVVPRGETRTNVLVYAPTGGGIVSARATPGPQGLFAQVHDGLSVGARTFTLAPGGRATLHLVVDTGTGQAGDVLVRSTPTARQAGRATIASACR
ncbi:DUF4012 domain-containing protein [Luteimicrobium subarcticum]|uniref:Uncharacterized protein DUF4012 n=1 Tax=Luteimicrobium subarcticum TaxID=620910 RepID=A0A2M8WUZ7_9MICO|nr:DUF4012 domain-containing protein [Luteimicrobium subarcticum]PJI94728.1 uncharacterized protein DUF4012 [Luteimicrobium subarcticum]